MRRLSSAALAFLLVGQGSPAGAVELLKNLRFSGQLDLQTTSARNIVDFTTNRENDGGGTHNDRLGDAQTRIMLQADWSLLDDVHATVTLRKNDRSYGTSGGNPFGDGNSQSITASGGNDVLGNVFLDQAYFKIDKIAGQVDAAFGRQFYGESGDLIIYYGPSDKAHYGLPVTALDAARFDWNNEWLGVTGVVAKVDGSPVGTAPIDDTDLRGLNLAFRGNEYLRGSLYAWNRVIHRTQGAGVPPSSGGADGGKNDHLWVLGGKGKLTLGPFWLKGEYAQNLGEERRTDGSVDRSPAANYIGYLVHGNTGVKLESETGHVLSTWGEMTLASGRSRTREAHNDGFVAINGDYRPGTIYGRFGSNPAVTSIFANSVQSDNLNSLLPDASLNNRWIFGGGTRYTPGFANRASLGVSWWEYRLQRLLTLPAGTEGYRGNRHLGAELDVDLTWVHSENVAFAAGWATFQPGGLIYHAIQSTSVGTNPPTSNSQRGVNPVQLSYFDVRVKF